MGTPAVLDDAWRAAQPKLASITSSLNTDKRPKQRVIRVGQLDAQLLDQELVQTIQDPITRALSLFNTRLKSRIEPELHLLIQLVLYKLSIWDNGGSYGAKLQDLRYVASSSTALSLSPSGLPRATLLIHGSLTILFPYLHTRLRAYALSQAWPDAPSSDRRRKAWEILSASETLHTLLGLLNFVAFLWSGRYGSLADRLSQMRLMPSRGQVKREVSYEFMNRQMVWHAFTEFLLFSLPLLHARTVRRRVYRFLSFFKPANPLSAIPNQVATRVGLVESPKESTSTRKRRGKYHSLPADQCAICAENASFNLNISEPANMFSSLVSQTPSIEGQDDEPPAYPINIPYVASCGDIYCYSCIAERLIRTADDWDEEHGWECLRCGTQISSAERYEVEVIEAGSGSDYDFSSDLDLDVTDMSGSMGSYSGSGLSDEY